MMTTEQQKELAQRIRGMADEENKKCAELRAAGERKLAHEHNIFRRQLRGIAMMVLCKEES